MTLALLPAFAESFMLAFARVGALVMLMPGIGERALPARARLALALALALLLTPGLTRPPGPVLALLAAELAIGLMLGAAARLVMAAAETAGAFAAQGIGLSFAQSIDPTQGQQGDLLAGFFRMTAALVVLAADLHHLALAGIAGSYRSFPPGALPPAGDALALFLETASGIFAAAAVFAAPFVLFGLLFNLGVGLVGRMAPQIQLFFLAIPVSVGLGIWLLGVALPGLAEAFRSFAGGALSRLLPLH